MRRSSFIVFQLVVLILSLTACTIGRRYHNRGLHVEWSSAKNKGHREGIVETKTGLNIGIQRKTFKDFQSPSDSVQTAESAFLSVESYNDKLAISEKDAVINDTRESAVRQLAEKAVSSGTAGTKWLFSQFPAAKEKRLNHVETGKRNNYASKQDSHNPGVGLRIFGWLLIFIGLFTILFISIVFGILIFLFGILFAASGHSSRSTAVKPADPKPEETEQLVDVLYLKNGSMIKGKLLEFVSGGNVKIQTADGSIFVFKSEEVDKIIKEPLKR